MHTHFTPINELHIFAQHFHPFAHHQKTMITPVFYTYQKCIQDAKFKNKLINTEIQAFPKAFDYNK